MWPFSLFSRKSNVTIQDIDVSSESDSTTVLLGISDGIPIHLQPRMAYYLNERNADLGDATNMISSNIAGIKRGLRKDKEITFDSPFLELLDNPGEGYSSAQFWKEISESYLLTQESWIIGRGNINREPLSLAFVRPYDISVVFDNTDGLPRTIRTTANKDRRIYRRFEDSGVLRYIDDTGLNEIFPIIGNVSIVDEWRGRSPLVKLFYDISMNTDGKRHNVSLLKNGMRTTGVLSPGKASSNGQFLKWNKDAVQTIEEKMRAFNQGSGNAGNILILSTPADINGLSQTNKEMDYLDLLQNSKETIYNVYRIPLPLVLSNAMTLDNYTTANRVYYTKAVFPVFDSLGAGIVQTVGRRFNIEIGVTLSFNEASIRDLQAVLVENMKLLKETEVMKVDEIRSIGGFEETDGGDVVLVSANKIPLQSVAGGFPDDAQSTEE